jgi:hypothetical protein
MDIGAVDRYDIDSDRNNARRPWKLMGRDQRREEALERLFFNNTRTRSERRQLETFLKMWVEG